jgi:hypothetical protein
MRCRVKAAAAAGWGRSHVQSVLNMASVAKADYFPSRCSSGNGMPARPRDGALPTPFIIGVAGGSASGKTSVCQKIIHQLQTDNGLVGSGAAVAVGLWMYCDATICMCVRVRPMHTCHHAACAITLHVRNALCLRGCASMMQPALALLCTGPFPPLQPTASPPIAIAASTWRVATRAHASACLCSLCNQLRLSLCACACTHLCVACRQDHRGILSLSLDCYYRDLAPGQDAQATNFDHPSAFAFEE